MQHRTGAPDVSPQPTFRERASDKRRVPRYVRRGHAKPQQCPEEHGEFNWYLCECCGWCSCCNANSAICPAFVSFVSISARSHSIAVPRPHCILPPIIFPVVWCRWDGNTIIWQRALLWHPSSFDANVSGWHKSVFGAPSIPAIATAQYPPVSRLGYLRMAVGASRFKLLCRRPVTHWRHPERP